MTNHLTGVITIIFLFLTHCQINHKVNSRVIRVENGWGYEIYSNEKIIVHQEMIPVIEGRCPFMSRKDARRTGRLAAEKLSAGRLPGITRQDLDSLKINLSGIYED